MKKTREVILEIDQQIIIKRAADVSCAWCSGCEGEVTVISPDEAAALACQSTRAIYRWVEEGWLHYLERPVGAGLICLNSFHANQKRLATPELTKALLL
jgi:hypothetical protein